MLHIARPLARGAARAALCRPPTGGCRPVPLPACRAPAAALGTLTRGPLAATQRRHASLLSKEASEAPEGYNRWLNIPAVVAIQASIGSMYAWSIFNNPLCRELGVIAASSGDWELTQIVPVFSTTACFFGLTCLLTPPWQERVGPRMTCVVASGCWAGGLAIAAVGTAMHSLPILYLGYGVFGGLGFGFGYITPTVNLIKWFPDKKGLATGMSVAGFAGGAVIGAPLNELLFKKYFVLPQQVGTLSTVDVVTEGGRRLVSHGGEMKEVVVATHDVAAQFPGVVEHGVHLVGTGCTGVSQTFATLSGLYAALMLGGSFAQRVPRAIPAPAAAAAAPPAPAAAAPAAKEQKPQEQELERYVPIEQVMKTPQLYLFWLLSGGNAFAGVTIISAAKNIVSEIFGAANAALVTPAFAASYVVALAVANVGGRLIWSSFSDKLGRRNIFILFGLVGIPTLFSLPTLTSMVATDPSTFPVYAFCTGSALLVSFYGASTAILPAYIADTFGVKNTTTIFGRCLTGWATAALVGPVAMSQLRASSYRSAIYDLAGKVDPARFQQEFGADVSELSSLIEAKTVTIQALMEIMPPGTVDPTPTLFDSSMYMMACALTVAFIANYLIKPVPASMWVTGRPS